MSGHSKWANIKHRKAAQDAKRGNLFQKLVKAIIIAAKEGGGDPSTNVRLKAALDRAKAASVPANNIDRAIKRGTGEIEGAVYEELVYEGYGPDGVAVIIECLTDNKNRTTPEIRVLLDRSGGSLGATGSVSWMFERRGVINLSGDNLDEEELMEAALECGAEDVERDDGFVVYTNPSDLNDVKEALEARGYGIENAESQMVPKTTVVVSNPDKAKKILKLMDMIESHDDVQSVASNFDISQEIMDEID
ncbi:YebC/PmpR family DNA-binding transcriptional regulator [Dethiosulfovibrio salsuginis]|uniref:Probable transcriptional regulatory protein SAMN06275492_10171 n=1 Tax=Dethiosulfovibrio salsuginis TaxID=561720 RepID=A0A1X7I4K0_9BACT|nr:YebC/PmpR family DNA-binding transcriptional regulator [Dethiosulfovibrio salsuginis]SMG08928.1 DNA-binding regulatory protein, YebC/PmpR family [Dethiosulfovibrio salsuginis]